MTTAQFWAIMFTVWAVGLKAGSAKKGIYTIIGIILALLTL